LFTYVRGPGLAIRIGVIVCAQACLVPQSVDPLATVAHPPPRFVVEGIDPTLLAPVLQLYRQGSGDAALTPPCHCELEFSIPSVEEDDPTVSLEVRWFVDYDVTVPASVRQWKKDPLPGSFDSTNTIRPLTSVYRLDADTLSIFTNGVHVVEAVVGETAGFDDSPTLVRVNRTMKPGYASDEHKFVVNVNVQQDASRPTCPTQKPSVRVCR
jgi:hypothetical protein